MASKMRWVMRGLLAGGLALSVAGCGGGGGSSSSGGSPVVVATPQEDKFGTMFGIDFRAVANSEPANVSDGDIVPVSLTTEPITIN